MYLLFLLPGELRLVQLVGKKGELQDVDRLRHPASMVVGTRAGEFVEPPLLPPHTPTKEQLRQLEELLVVASGKEVLVLRKEPQINEGQDLRNVRKEGGRDRWELEIIKV